MGPEYMLCTEIDFDIQNMFSSCSAKIRAANKDLPVYYNWEQLQIRY